MAQYGEAYALAFDAADYVWAFLSVQGYEEVLENRGLRNAVAEGILASFGRFPWLTSAQENSNKLHRPIPHEMRALLRLPPAPFAQSFWVHDGLLCAGCYPGDRDATTRDQKLTGLLNGGIRRVLSLMGSEVKRFEPYAPRLRQLAEERGDSVECLNLPIPDGSVPSEEAMREIQMVIDQSIEEEVPLYLHCWGGHGRTSTIIACHLIERGLSAQEAIDAVLAWRAELPKRHYPFEGDQEQFVRAWSPVAGTLG